MVKVLVIEDEACIRESTIELLEAEGFEAIEAINGLEGLQKAQELLPALIVCDVMMPEMDGYALLEKLQENEKTANIPFIFLTAKVDKKDMRQGMDLGADDYLTKPFSRAELIFSISARLKKKQKSESERNRLKVKFLRSLQDGLSNRLSNISRLADEIMLSPKETEETLDIVSQIKGQVVVTDLLLTKLKKSFSEER
ncbi:MAG TPA: response regulator [Chroococcales cyanobacterium]|jgi:DNA-binding response OmpR family regulator